MAESVAKQLHFSPVASTPLEQQQFHLHTVQRRLDARPDWGDGSSNPTGEPLLQVVHVEEDSSLTAVAHVSL